jgi:ribosomal-protein-alanine acetyltransferase
VSALAETVSLRDARESDLDDVAALELACFPVPWKRDYFASEIDAPHRFNRVARDARGELAGYVFCAWAGGEVHVNKIAVDERQRRRGVATLLMSDVFALAYKVRAEDIYLEVRFSNAPARIFYEGLGFEDAGRRSGYYFDGEDALVMVRRFVRLDARRPGKGDSR